VTLRNGLKILLTAENGDCIRCGLSRDFSKGVIINHLSNETIAIL